jgi:hypothetical protein
MWFVAAVIVITNLMGCRPASTVLVAASCAGELRAWIRTRRARRCGARGEEDWAGLRLPHGRVLPAFEIIRRAFPWGKRPMRFVCVPARVSAHGRGKCMILLLCSGVSAAEQ